MKSKVLKIITAVSMLVLLAGTATGCGKKEIDVTEGLEVEFNGVDGYGTARISNEFFWEEEALEAAGLVEKADSGNDDEAIGAIQGIYAVESAVEYTIAPKENLSNGDEVTVTAKIRNESVEDYKIEFTGGEKKFTVEGLKEVEQIDLFEGVDVEFQGISPYVKAVVNSQDANKDVYASYSIDKSEGLTIGDTVTVTAEYDEEGLLQKGYVAAESTKEFTVPECDRYVSALADIPAETIEKINKQFEDAFRAYVTNKWKEPECLQNIEYAGSYLLTPKEEGYSNIYYGVYRITATPPEGEFTFYSYIQYSKLVILKDGTCSIDLTAYKMPEGSALAKNIYSGEIFPVGDYFYLGYQELDSLFNNCVTKNIDKYEYESTVAE